MSKLPLLLGAIALWLIAQQFNSLHRAFVMPSSSKYEPLNIHGWRVMVSPNVVANRVIYQPALDQLSEDLAGIIEAVPSDSVRLLRHTVIWLEQGMPTHHLNYLFFNGSKALIKQYGLVSESFGGVIVGDTSQYLENSSVNPWQLLHELTHAYHNTQLNLAYKPIHSAYENAVNAKLFSLKSNARIHRHGAATKNHKEYLSELSVIYFGNKESYPKNRAELAEHDPVGYCVVVKAWGLQGRQEGEAPLVC